MEADSLRLVAVGTGLQRTTTFDERLNAMLKIDEKTMKHMEMQYPGIRATIHFFEEAKLPICSRCSSTDTASVGGGVIGRTIYISTATTKFKLIANEPRSGKYFCNTCDKFFD